MLSCVFYNHFYTTSLLLCYKSDLSILIVSIAKDIVRMFLGQCPSSGFFNVLLLFYFSLWIQKKSLGVHLNKYRLWSESQGDFLTGKWHDINLHLCCSKTCKGKKIIILQSQVSKSILDEWSPSNKWNPQRNIGDLNTVVNKCINTIQINTKN